MATVLLKLSTHIGNLKKFLKASALLRQLFTEGKLSGAHGELVFQVSHNFWQQKASKEATNATLNQFSLSLSSLTVGF